MKINIYTLFPSMFTGVLENSIIKRAISKKVVEIKIINIRDYTLDKYNRVDSAPIGGGAGLIMKCQPILDAINKTSKDAYKILLSPLGKTYKEKDAYRLKEKDEISLICGHYEGVDFRINKYMDELISIGDYILTGGEIASMAIVDSLVRLLDGAISKDSLSNESFNDDLLEYPQYTEPYDYKGDKVPLLLYSGNHTAINKFNKKEQFKLTKKYRPDLFKKYKFSKDDIKLLKEIDSKDTPKWENDAIKKGSKYLPKN